jgi:phosphoglycerol transferase MdoB-like AlkP superfamily enzyme
MPNKNTWLSQRYAPVYVLSVAYLVVGTLLRLWLWWQFGRAADVSLANVLWILPVGFINDFLQAAYLSLPLAIYLSLLPDKWYRTKFARGLLVLGCVATLAGLLFISAAEYFFFEEFDSRFNLVAVDYLLYPTEVIGDIRAEYPLGVVIGVSLVVAAVICWLLRRYLFPIPDAPLAVAAPKRFAPYFKTPLTVQLLIVVLAIAIVRTDSLAKVVSTAFSDAPNRVATELASNGASSFFGALRTSEISYPDFYSTRAAQANYKVLREFLAHQGGKFKEADPLNLTRHFDADPKGLGHMNVVVVVEEAFGAEFSKLYGAQVDLTPNFDRYAQQGIWFRNMYASGTRTVRGLEAISASFPPIPSESILRRPNNEGIATWGSVMSKQGYQTSFVYGGYGYFDNMNYYFANNGFDVLDRTDIKAAVRFENIWGVSDEDIFDRALLHFDERSAAGRPFFSMIMTTSNHKPFTFRAGVPDVPVKGGGRAAGVRYADFAIGYLLSEAQKHKWFDNTIFVVVADHGARVYGKAEIPLHSYEIPMLIYAPKLIRPQQVDLLTGQIDVAPTVLGLLGLEYDAPFFGTDILACAQSACAQNRVALFSHNYDVATFRNGKLAVLGLSKHDQSLTYDRATNTYQEIAPDRELTDLTIAIYQTAYEQFQARRYK